VDSLTDWLIDSPTPSIQYLTLRRLLGRGEDDADVQAARRAMRMTGPIPKITARQSPGGNWEGDPHYYGRKYVGTHWSLILLPELAADPDDPALRQGVEFMLTETAKNGMLEDRFNRPTPSPAEFGFTCLWGNILRYAVYFGYADDPRVSPMVEYMVRNLTTGGCHCHINNFLPCAWGAARVLWGLAALSNRSQTVESAILTTVDFLLESGYELAVGAYPTRGTVHTLWSKLNFPLFYQTDVLFVLRVLGEVGALGRPSAQPVLQWLEAQRLPDGHWRGNNPFSSRTWRIGTGTQDVNRWVSLHAAIVLQQAEAQRQSA
jgi:hypothetical protein